MHQKLYLHKKFKQYYSEIILDARIIFGFDHIGTSIKRGTISINSFKQVMKTFSLQFLQ